MQAEVAMNTNRFVIFATLLVVFISSSLSAQDKPKEFATFFAEVSVELLAKQLGPGESMGHAGRDSTDWQSHYNWAAGQSIETIRRDLVEKLSIMVDVKAAKGRDALGKWYSLICAQWAAYGIDFGSSAANSTNATGHFRWASSRFVTLDAIKEQLEKRVDKIAASYLNLTVQQDQPKILPPPDDPINLPINNESAGDLNQLLGAQFHQEFQAEAARFENELLTAQQHLVKVDLNDLRQKYQLKQNKLRALPKFERVRIYWLWPKPFHNGATLTCGSTVIVDGTGFGNTPGVASLHLESPVNGKDVFNFEPGDGESMDACWQDDAIFLRVPVIRGFKRPIKGVIRVNRAQGNYLPDDYPVTILPRLELRQISGLNYFRPDFQDDLSTYSETGDGKFLFVSHHPDCGLQGDSGVDFFFINLPDYVKVKKVVFTQIEPAKTKESFSKALRAASAVISAIKNGVVEALLWEVGKEIVDFIGGLFGAGNYGCTIIKEPDQISPLLAIKWHNTCWFNEYRNKPVMYLVTFFVLVPEGEVLEH
jgi:hypothetical protein